MQKRIVNKHPLQGDKCPLSAGVERQVFMDNVFGPLNKKRLSVEASNDSGGGQGKDDRVLLQDLDPNLWAWFSGNDRTRGFVPLHRKENYIRSRRNGYSKRRDIKPPDIVPKNVRTSKANGKTWNSIAYRYRNYWSWEDHLNKKSRIHRHLMDVDEFFIEALTEWHSLNWFQAKGTSGTICSPKAGTNIRVSKLQPANDNAMEEDHSNYIADYQVEDELKKYCKLAASNYDGKEATFYPEIQEQRRKKQNKLQRYHYHRVQRRGFLCLLGYITRLNNPKYIGKPSCPKPECEIEVERILNEEKAQLPTKLTMPIIDYPSPYILKNLGSNSEWAWLQNRLGMNEQALYNRYDLPFLELPRLLLARIHGESRIYSTSGAKPSQHILFGMSTKDKMKLMRGLRRLGQFLPFAPTCNRSTPASTVSCTPEAAIVEGPLHDNHVRQYYMDSGCATKIDKAILSYINSCESSIDKHAKLVQLFRDRKPIVTGHEAEEVIRTKDTASRIAESILKRHIESKPIPSATEVDNLELFRNRKNSFTKQLYIEPQTDSVSIITLDKESALKANMPIVKEVINDQDLIQKVLDQISVCPTCGKGE